MLAKVPRHPSRMKWVLSEIKGKKVVIGNERWSGLCFNPLYCWKQVCVLIRYTVGKPLSLEGEGKRVQCLLRENEKTRRWSIAEDASESTKASLLICLQETLIVQH